jgi:hypothetical protein
MAAALIPDEFMEPNRIFSPMSNVQCPSHTVGGPASPTENACRALFSCFKAVFPGECYAKSWGAVPA